MGALALGLTCSTKLCQSQQEILAATPMGGYLCPARTGCTTSERLSGSVCFSCWICIWEGASKRLRQLPRQYRETVLLWTEPTQRTGGEAERDWVLPTLWELLTTRPEVPVPRAATAWAAGLLWIFCHCQLSADWLGRYLWAWRLGGHTWPWESIFNIIAKFPQASHCTNLTMIRHQKAPIISSSTDFSVKPRKRNPKT